MAIATISPGTTDRTHVARPGTTVFRLVLKITKSPSRSELLAEKTN